MVKSLKSESGQVAIEYILIAVITMVITLTIVNEIKKRQIFPQMVDGPSAILRGMVESGTWENAKKAKDNHPSLLKRKVASRFE